MAEKRRRILSLHPRGFLRVRSCPCRWTNAITGPPICRGFSEHDSTKTSRRQVISVKLQLKCHSGPINYNLHTPRLYYSGTSIRALYNRCVPLPCILGLGVTRTVRRNRIDFGSSPDVTAYWMWSENAGQSVPYQVEASVDIELAYQRNLPIVNLAKCSSQLPYTINFRNMDQTRHHFNTRRGIKRVPLSLGASLQSLLKESPSPVSSVPSAATLSGISRGLAPSTHGATSSTMNAHIPSSSVLSTATTRHGHHNRKPKGHVSLATTSPSYVPPPSASHLEHTPLLPVVSHLGHVSAPPHSSSHSGHTSALGTTPNFVHSPTVGLANTSTTSNWSVPTSTFSTLYTSTTTAMSTIPFGTTSAPRTSSTATKSKSSRSRSNAKSSTTKTSPVVMKASSRVKKSQKKTREIKPHLAVGGASNCCEAQEDPLSVYARKLKRLKAKDDEVSYSNRGWSSSLRF